MKRIIVLLILTISCMSYSITFEKEKENESKEMIYAYNDKGVIVAKASYGLYEHIDLNDFLKPEVKKTFRTIDKTIKYYKEHNTLTFETKDNIILFFCYEETNRGKLSISMTLFSTSFKQLSNKDQEKVKNYLFNYYEKLIINTNNL